MKLFFIPLLAVLFLSACKNGSESAQSEDENSSDTVAAKGTSNTFVIDTTAYRNLLQGIWAKDENSNAAFEIKGDSLFYFEDPIPVYYEIKQDSFRLLIDGGRYSSKVLKLSKDSFNRVEYGEVIKLYKRN
jgi:hypothetical protein